MFLRRKKAAAPPMPFDKTGKVPVLRSSICTGEQVAGFKDAVSGRFTEIMLIRTAGDLEEFLRAYGLREEELRREW